MTNNHQNKVLRKKYLSKIFISIWLLSISYVHFHHIPEETYYHEFSANYTAFIQMWLSGYVNTDIFSIFPMFFDIYIPISYSDAADYLLKSNSIYPSMTMMYLIQSRLLDLQPHQLMLLPVGVLIIPIAAFAMVREFLSDYNWTIVYCFSIYIIIYMSQLKPFRAAYGGTYTFILLFLFIYCIKISIMDESTSRLRTMSAIFLISLTTWWHTMGAVAAFYIGSIIILIVTLQLLSKITGAIDLSGIDSLRSSLPYLSLQLLLFLMIFNIWNEGYLARFATALFAGDLVGEQIISDLIRKMTGNTQNQFLYIYNYADTPIGQFYYYSNYGIYIIAGVLLSVGTLAILYNLLFQTKPTDDQMTIKRLVLVSAVGLAQVILLIAYSYAGLGFRYVPFLFSLMGLYAILSCRRSKAIQTASIWAVVLLVFFAGTMVVSSHVTGELGYDSQIEYEGTAASHQFIESHAAEDEQIFTDFSIFGKYIYRESKTEAPDTNYRRLSAQEYAVLVGQSQSGPDLRSDYFVVDFATMEKGSPIHSYGARSLLQPKPNEIRSNQNLSTVYSDGSLSVTKLTG